MTVTEEAGVFLENGVWMGRRSSRSGGPALLLDRDGVVVVEVHYLHRVADVRLETGAAALIRAARRLGLAVAVVTNQSGIDRGMFGWDAFFAVEAEIARRLAAEDAAVDAVIACPFHPRHTPGYGPGHDCWRKPGPAMITHLGGELGLDLGRSWMVGDKAGDIGAARAAGLAGAVHVMTGHGPEERGAALALATPGFPVLAAAGLPEIEARLGEMIAG